jgi:hypothetical protein
MLARIRKFELENFSSFPQLDAVCCVWSIYVWSIAWFELRYFEILSKSLRQVASKLSGFVRCLFKKIDDEFKFEFFPNYIALAYPTNNFPQKLYFGLKLTCPSFLFHLDSKLTLQTVTSLNFTSSLISTN